jgi:hypothetical protein
MHAELVGAWQARRVPDHSLVTTGFDTRRDDQRMRVTRRRNDNDWA